MFTGLIQTTGTVAAIDKSENRDTRFLIESDLDLTREQLGASICCSGACMTVTAINGNAFEIAVSDESLSKTSLKFWQEGSRVNLESSLRAGDPLGGHFVTGHVDGVAEVISIDEVKDSHKIRLSLPGELMMFVAQKGSIALDGVSLTVNNVGTDWFEINIIPHTWQKTIFQNYQAGTLVNVEIDLIARYLLRQTLWKDGQK